MANKYSQYSKVGTYGKTGSSRPVNQTRFYQCGRKVLFLSEQQAKTRAGQINKDNRDKGDPVQLEPYQCSHCKGWHLRKKRNQEVN